MRIENRTARFGQVLSATLVALWLVAVAVAWLSGPSDGLAAHWTWLIFGGFGIGALGVLLLANRRPAITLDIGGKGDMTLTEATLFRRRSRTLPAQGVLDIALVDSEDQDGDPYIRVVLVLADGTQAVIAEGHRREDIERIAGMVRAALGRA